MLEEYDTWSQAFNQIFEVRATDMLIKQLPREKAEVSSDYSSAAEFRTMITDRLMGNQANEHSRGNTTSQVSVELLKCCRIFQQCSLESVASEYSTLVARKGMPIFSKWPIVGNPSESANWST